MNEIKQDKKSKYAHGALVLLLSGIVCKFIGAFYRIPLSNILGAEGIGVYQLIFPIYSLFLIFISGRIPIALSKIVAECRARGEIKRAKRFLLQSLIYLIVVSIIFSIIFLILARKIALLQGNSLAELGYFVVAIAIFFASVLTAFRGYFQGYQNMIPTAISQITEQVFKLILGLLFASIFMKSGIAFGVFGAMLGVLIGEIVSLIYLTFAYFLHKKKLKNDILMPENSKIKINFMEDFNLLLKKSLPITLNATILPLILAIDSFLMINLLMRSGFDSTLSTQMFGVYSGMVNSLINFPTIVALSLAIYIIPAISYIREKGENISELISSSMKIILFISIPVILIFLFFSNQIMTVLYPSVSNPYFIDLGSNLLKISAINILYISLLQISTAILQTSNKSGISLINLLFAGIIKIISLIFFVLSPLNIYGAAISSILCYSLASGLNIIALKNQFNFELKFKKIGYIFLNSTLMLGTSFGLFYLFNFIFSLFFSLFLSLLFAGIIYLFFSLLFPIFEDDELNKIPFGNKICGLRNKIISNFKIKKV